MMKLLALVFFVLSKLAPAAAAAATTGGSTIQGRLEFPDGSAFNATTPVTLNHGEFWTYSKLDGSFIFRNVPAGVHQLDVQSATHHFGAVKIQLLANNNSGEPPKCVEYAYPGAAKKAIEHPVVMTAYATLEYFEKRPAFSIFVILKNPMFLMMAFSVGIMFLMPQMMQGMTDEEKAQMREQMASQQDPTKMLSNLLEGFTGGAEEPAPKKKIKK